MTLKQHQDRNITMLKTEFERKAGEVHKIFEKAMKTVSWSHVSIRIFLEDCCLHTSTSSNTRVFVSPSPAYGSGSVLFRVA